MTSVFYCTAASSDTREAIAKKTKKWWQDWCAQHRATMYVLNPAILGCNAIEFNRERRRWAEEEATEDYILADDDCLPTDGDSLSRGFELLRKHNDFAILSAWPINAGIQKWTPGISTLRCRCGGVISCKTCWGKLHYQGEYPVYEDLDIMEHVSVGGLRFMRKGAMWEWPKMDPDSAGYDMIQADYLRSIGYMVGYLQHVRMKHLGEGPGMSDLQNAWAKWQEENHVQR